MWDVRQITRGLTHRQNKQICAVNLKPKFVPKFVVLAKNK